MLLYTYELVRRLNEEREERSLRRYAQRLGDRHAEAPRDAEVIELVFAARCDEEDRLGA